MWLITSPGFPRSNNNRMGKCRALISMSWHFCMRVFPVSVCFLNVCVSVRNDKYKCILPFSRYMLKTKQGAIWQLTLLEVKGRVIDSIRQHYSGKCKSLIVRTLMRDIFLSALSSSFTLSECSKMFLTTYHCIEWEVHTLYFHRNWKYLQCTVFFNKWKFVLTTLINVSLFISVLCVYTLGLIFFHLGPLFEFSTP